MVVVNYLKKGNGFKFQIAAIRNNESGMYTFPKSWYEDIFRELNNLRGYNNYATCQSTDFTQDIKKALNFTNQRIIFNELF